MREAVSRISSNGGYSEGEQGEPRTSPASAMTTCLKVYVLALVLALISSTQCFAYCDSAMQTAGCTSMGGHCGRHAHHRSKSGQACSHPHNELFSPEHNADNARISPVQIALPMAAAPLKAKLVRRTQAWWIAPVFPPGRKLYLRAPALLI